MIKNVAGKDIENFIESILLKEDLLPSVAVSVAKGLVQTSLRGVDSHGVRLFPHYLRALKAGRINPKPKYSFKKTSSSTGILDADHTFGHAAGLKAVKHAVKLAQASGSGHVAVKNSSHFGAAAFYALEIASHDMIGMSFTHADSLMLTHNSTQSFLGTNPICFAAPCAGEDPFCLDMATTMFNFNKIRQLREKKLVAPLGIGADAGGKETTDAEKITQLLPIGQYKGFGLSLMVEILCSMLTGMPYGRDISSMYKAPIEQKRLLGHFFSAIRIDCFQRVNVFKKRVAELLKEIRNLPPRDTAVQVQVAGDPEKANFKKRSVEGLPLSEVEYEAFMEISRKYNMPLKEKKK